MNKLDELLELLKFNKGEAMKKEKDKIETREDVNDQENKPVENLANSKKTI